jgi:outer membrane receptor protein involved in Fe transport
MMDVPVIRQEFMRSNTQWMMACLMSSAAITIPPVAFAESEESGPASGPLEEIVVTAQKRVSTVQTTPISITAVTGEDLQARGIVNFTSLAQSTPGVSLKSEGPGQTEIELRGMTSSGGNSPTVGFYLDDIPLTAPAGAQNGKVVIDPTLYDLKRIEVLRGPQGTLYGAGSMGGTVRLISNQPDPSKLEGSAQSTLSGTAGGGFNHSDNLMLNIPLIDDVLALRVVATEAHTSGWIDRIVAGNYPIATANGSLRGKVQAAPIEKRYPGSNAQQLYGFRAAVLWKPTDALSITPAFFYQSSRQDGISAFDSDPGTQTHYQVFDYAEPLTDRITVYSLNVNYAFDEFDMTSSTAQWNRRSTQTQDASENFNNPNTGATYASNNGLPNPGYYGPGGSGRVYGREDDPSGQFSQELRFASTGAGALNWVGGAFFSNYSATWNFDGITENPSAYMDLGTFAPATTTSWFKALSPTRLIQYAVFGEASYDLTSALKANVGLRYYRYDYRFTSVISGWGSALGAATPSESGVIKQSADGLNPKVNLSYTFNPDLMTYATLSKGFRPGGGNAQYPVTGPYWSAVYAPYKFQGSKWPSSYQPDTVWSFEIGEKARFFDRRLTVNGSIYYERWNDIQLLALPGDWALNINGNHATIWGGEIETRAVLGRGFELGVSAGYTKAYVDSGTHWQITPVNELSDVAPLTGNVNLNYTRELTDQYTFISRLETAYVGPRYSLAFPYGYSLNGKYIQLPSYGLTNLRAGVQSRAGWGAAVFVNNVFNRHAQLESLFQEDLPSAAFNRIVTNQPLTAGVDLTYRF